MTSMASRKGAAPAGMILMVLAFASMAGLMYWLNIAAQPSSLAVVEDPSGAGDFEGMIAVAADSFGVDPAAFLGETVVLSNLPVNQMLGPSFFLVEAGVTQNYLVRLGPDPVAEGVILLPGDVVSVRGLVGEMTDELAASWAEAGVLGEGEAVVALINPTYITASVVEVAGAAGGGQ